MRDDDRVRILHMIDASESLAQFFTGRTRADLDTDRMLLFAAVRAIAGRAAASMNRRFMARICDPVPACQNTEHLEERHLPGAGIGTLAYAFDGAEGLCLAASACRHGGFH